MGRKLFAPRQPPPTLPVSVLAVLTISIGYEEVLLNLALLIHINTHSRIKINLHIYIYIYIYIYILGVPCYALLYLSLFKWGKKKNMHVSNMFNFPILVDTQYSW